MLSLFPYFVLLSFDSLDSGFVDYDIDTHDIQFITGMTIHYTCIRYVHRTISYQNTILYLKYKVYNIFF